MHFLVLIQKTLNSDRFSVFLPAYPYGGSMISGAIVGFELASRSRFQAKPCIPVKKFQID
jgi:hypothetical protein